MASYTNFPNGVTSMGVPLPSSGIPVPASGTTWFVDQDGGSDGYPGTSLSRPFATIQAAVDAAGYGDVIVVAPGAYDETVTIARPTTNDGSLALQIVGLGGAGAAFIEPSTEDAGGMVVNADDVTIMNLGIAAEDDTSAAALTVTGSRFRLLACKVEGGADQIIIGPGTVAQEAAGTHGVGADFQIIGGTICWGTDGIVLTCTDYGAVTQGLIQGVQFHNISGKCITEAVGSGGSAAVTFRNIVIQACVFDDLEDGTAPTNYVDLNGDNGNTGQLVGCYFPAAANGGLVLLSTAMHCVGNYFTGGISTGQPS